MARNGINAYALSQVSGQGGCLLSSPKRKWRCTVRHFKSPWRTPGAPAEVTRPMPWAARAPAALSRLFGGFFTACFVAAKPPPNWLVVIPRPVQPLFRLRAVHFWALKTGFVVVAAMLRAHKTPPVKRHFPHCQAARHEVRPPVTGCL